MERLANGIDYCLMKCDFGKAGDCFFEDKSKCYEKNIHDKLREYEQAEEKGLLIRLPCKVGSTVYHVANNRILEVENVDLFFLLLSVAENRFGKTVFLTKSEAEQALAKMKGE